MIRTLRVRNLAVIEELELALGPGLTVVTGETGAGKSILLGALALLRGGRVSSDLLRGGAGSATVEAVLEDPALLAAAREQGLAGEREEELLVTRTISREGRGRISVNGSLATATILRSLLGEAIEVAGQGEHLRLLLPETQSVLLDRFAGLEPEVGETSRLYRRWVDLAREIADRRRRTGERMRIEDRLRFEIEQIDGVSPVEGEIEALEAERSRLAHADRLGRETADAIAALGVEDGIRDRLARVAARVGQAKRLDASLQGAEGFLERALLELAEGLGELERYAAGIEVDPARLEAVEARRADLRRLQERYGQTVGEILEHRRRAAEELERVGGGAERLRGLEAELAEVGAALRRMAEGLTERRTKSAGDLVRAVQAELAALDLRRAHFDVRLESTPARAASPIAEEGDGAPEPPAGPRGRERAQFWIAPNPGEEPRRLQDAASGGELARILLAVRTALLDADRGRILLFDEVDAGIGGRTAGRVGERLRSLGRSHQVVCITHLPQIAALGDAHYRIAKQVRGGRTRTAGTALRGEERVEEIARLAGGGRVTAAARAHARELLAG